MLLPYMKSGLAEAGCDEAGRGCLAGSVYAAAVILPPHFRNELLNDSKQLSEKQRYELRPIIEQEAVAWAIGIVTPEEIDRINILNASFLAMHRAIEQLNPQPQHLLIDGNRFKPYPDIPHTCVVKGDGKYDILTDCMNNIPCMTGIGTKDIPQKSIVPPYANMDLHPTIACPFNCLKGNSRFFKCNHLYTKTAD